MCLLHLLAAHTTQRAQFRYVRAGMRDFFRLCATHPATNLLAAKPAHSGNTSANEAHTLHCSQPGTIGWVLPKLNAASSGVLRCVPTHPSLILPHDCPALTPMDGSNPDVGPAVTRNSPLISTASVLGKMYTNAVTSMQRCSASEPCRQRQGGSTCGKAYIQVQDVLEWSLCAECHRPRLTA